MHQNGKTDPALIENQLRIIAEGLSEAMRREVEKLRQAGLPIYISENGEVVDLQQPENEVDQAPPVE